MGSHLSFSRIVDRCGVSEQRFNLKRCRKSDKDEAEKDQPKRIKLNCTENYFYKTFFLEGQDSDVTIKALGREWKLHKSFLGHSFYFKTMFTPGNFVESSKKELELHLDDDYVSADALDMVFGSFYNSEIKIGRDNVMQILVIAQYLLLDEVFENCLKLAVQWVDNNNCIKMFIFARKFSISTLETHIFNWLLVNLMVIKTEKILFNMDNDLWLKLISNSKFVIETEFSLYNTLKLYILLKINVTESETKITIDLNQFKERNGQIPYLLSEQGKEYAELFKNLRLGNLLTSAEDCAEIYRDNLIPLDWIQPFLFDNWINLVSIESPLNSPGPCLSTVNVHQFEANAMRLSKLILQPDLHRWRWTSFMFGLDLTFLFDGKQCFLRRSHNLDNKKFLCISERQFLIRHQVYNLDDQKHDSNLTIKEMKLLPNDEPLVFKLKKEAHYPCIIFIELLFIMPNFLNSCKLLNTNVVASEVETSQLEEQ